MLKRPSPMPWSLSAGSLLTTMPTSLLLPPPLLLSASLLLPSPLAKKGRWRKGDNMPKELDWSQGRPDILEWRKANAVKETLPRMTQKQRFAQGMRLRVRLLYRHTRGATSCARALCSVLLGSHAHLGQSVSGSCSRTHFLNLFMVILMSPSWQVWPVPYRDGRVRVGPKLCSFYI